MVVTVSVARPDLVSVDVHFDGGIRDVFRVKFQRAVDFLDVENHPRITFKSQSVEQIGDNDYRFTGPLTIRGVTKDATLEVRYLGQWNTPWWEDGVDKGPKLRAGFAAKTKIDRNDYGMNWNGDLENGGLVVGNDVLITIDAEAILDD